MRQGHNLGYLNAPGVPGQPGELDLVGCGHCQRQIQATGGNGQRVAIELCHQCMRFLCERCKAELVTAPGCRVWEKRFEEHERRGAARRKLLEAAGLVAT